jgi:hypothetical protein
MKAATVTVRFSDLQIFHDLIDFIDEYAWHLRECAAIDADGDWRAGNDPCNCGYDRARKKFVGEGQAS